MKTVPLKSVARYGKDKVESNSLTPENYISTENLIPNRGGKTLSSYTPQSGKSSLFRKGDVLVSNIRPYFKKIWFAKLPGGCSNDVLVFKVDESIAFPKYAFYALSTDHFFDFMMAGSNGTKMPRGNKKSILNYPIFLPEIDKQKKIASILSAYDDLIENNLKRIKLLEEKAQLTYEEWFVRMKYPGHENDNVDSETGLPEGWMKGVLSDIIGFQNGFAYKSSRFEKSGFPVIKIKNIEDNTISISNVDFINPSYADETQKFRLYSGDLLIAMTGATVGKVGFVPILKKHAYLNQRVGRFLAKSKNNNISFVKSFFTIGDGLKHVTNIARGAAQPNISSSQILSIPLNIPTSNLLNKYSALSEKINKNILLLRSQNQNLKMARSILLPRLMSGMIDVDEIKYNYPKETFA